MANIDAELLEIGGQVDRLLLSHRRRSLPSSLLRTIESPTTASGSHSSMGFGS